MEASGPLLCQLTLGPAPCSCWGWISGERGIRGISVWQSRERETTKMGGRDISGHEVRCLQYAGLREKMLHQGWTVRILVRGPHVRTRHLEC